MLKKGGFSKIGCGYYGRYGRYGRYRRYGRHGRDAKKFKKGEIWKIRSFFKNGCGLWAVQNWLWALCALCAHVDIDILDILGCVYGRRWPRKSRESGNLYLQSLSSSPTKLLLHILIDQSAPKTLHALLKSLLQTSLPFCVSTCPTNC